MATTSLFDAGRWRAAMATRFGGLVPAGPPAGGGRPRGSIRSIDLGEHGVHHISGGPQVLARTPSAVRAHPVDVLKVSLVRRGVMRVEQNGAVGRAGPGEFLLYDTGRPYRIVFESSWEVEVTTVPRESLPVPGHRLATVLNRPFPAVDGIGHAYAVYLTDLAALPGDPDPVAAAHAGSAGIALLAAAVLQTLEPAAEAYAETVGDRLARYVEANAADPELSLQRTAGHHHLSVRSVQRAFATRGLTFSGLVRRARLDGIRRDLADPTLADLSVTEIAHRWGVVDRAWLSRAFRAEFGRPPREFRRTAGSPRF